MPNRAFGKVYSMAQKHPLSRPWKMRQEHAEEPSFRGPAMSWNAPSRRPISGFEIMLRVVVGRSKRP
jgi:hypothetical protein